VRVVRVDDITDVFHGELGEEIYELIGQPSTIGATSRLSVAYVVIPPGKSSPAHRHEIAEEIYYVVKGRGTMQVNDKRFTVQAGHAILIAPSEIHQIRNYEVEGSLEFLAISGPPWTQADHHPAELPFLDELAEEQL